MAKYNNVKIDGYDSKKEYRRAKDLKLLEKKGIITGLQEQVNTSLFRLNIVSMKCRECGRCYVKRS